MKERIQKDYYTQLSGFPANFDIVNVNSKTRVLRNMQEEGGYFLEVHLYEINYNRAMMTTTTLMVLSTIRSETE